MKISEKFIKKAWIFSDLKRIRESTKSSTYNVFDYDKLPPIPAHLPDDFNWLTPNEEFRDADGNYVIEGVDFSEGLRIIEEQANNVGLTLPISIINFLSNPEINGKIYSNTDCFFELGDFIEKVTIENEDYYLLHFMSDSQYCYLWYICFNQSGEYFILSSYKVFGHNTEIINSDSDFIGYYCASSFEEFIYRFSIENRIWSKITWYKTQLEADEKYKTELDADEKEYISHYLN